MTKSLDTKKRDRYFILLIIGFVFSIVTYAFYNRENYQKEEQRKAKIREAESRNMELELNKVDSINSLAIKKLESIDKEINAINKEYNFNEDLISLIKSNPNVVEVQLTKGNTLAISVLNNGQDFNPMALLYFRMAKEKGNKVEMVKILDAVDAEFNVGENGSPYGTVLAKSFGD